MKKFTRITAFLMTTVLAAGIVTSHGKSRAAVFDSLDSNTAVAGASAALRNYMESNEDYALRIAEALNPIMVISADTETVAGAATPEPETITNGETIYEQERVGVAAVGSMLNVRQAASTLSDVVEYLVRGDDIVVIGERYVNGNIWYKVRVGSTEGYVAGTYILFDQAADEFRAVVAEERKDPAEMPTDFILGDDISALPKDVQDTLRYYAKEISWVLREDYPAAAADTKYVNTYSVLVYLLELYQSVQDIANEYNLSATFTQADIDITAVELNRQKLSELTGNTESDFFDMISEEQKKADEAAAAAAAAQAAAEAAANEAEAERLRQEAAAAAAAAAAAQEAANKAAAQAAANAAAQAAAGAAEGSSNPTGRSLADFAASWVGKIHYGWGANQFYVGGYVDCSHFTYNVYLQFGLVGGYTTSTGQRSWGRPVAIEDIQPGDLVCYNGHVAIYYGNGMIVHAPAAGRDIEYGSMYLAPIVGVRRLY